jgi:hypothetical protein
MSVLDLILNHDPQVHLLWEMRCDCAGDRNPLIGAVYAHGGDRHLYLPSMKGRHAATGVTVRRGPKEVRLDGSVAEIAECGRCRNHFTLTSAPVELAYLMIRMGVPADDPEEAGEYVKTLQVPFDAAAIQVVPGLFLTPLGKTTHAQVAPPLTD